MGSLDFIENFDKEIARIEAIRLFLGLELEKYEDLLLETKNARLKAIKRFKES